MTRYLLLVLWLASVPEAAAAQTYAPQSPTGLSVSFTTEHAGGTRLLIFGEVRNASDAPAAHVALLAEGLDAGGRVVSRARGYVLGVVPSRGNVAFEIRMLTSGSEKRYRVQIESFEFIVGGGN